MGTCVTGIDAHGATHRRCSNNYANETNEFPNDHFRVCISNNCNTDIFPTNRLHCYQCNGEPECDFINWDSTELSTNKLKPEACSTFSVLDQCFAYLSDSKWFNLFFSIKTQFEYFHSFEEGTIYRGCLTDPSEERLLCDQQTPNKSSRCVKCGESGCNDMPKMREPLLSCVHCSESEECAFGQSREKAILCKSSIQFGNEESCFTHFNYGKLEKQFPLNF